MGCFKEEDENKETSRRPSDSPFKQQTMKAWQPVLTASTVMPIFFLVAVIFVTIGIALLVSSNGIKEVVVEYSGDPDCKKCVIANKIVQGCNCTVSFTLDTKWEGDIYFYYGLSNFYQNHRRYVRSRDDNQLNGQLSQKVNPDCKPFATGALHPWTNNSQQAAYLPCGSIANSMFNDKFSLKLASNIASVPFTDKDITWKSDREIKFQNPKNLDELNDYAKPPNWFKNITQLQGHLQNQDFIVWMRIAAFPTFRKLYRKLDYHEAAKGGPYGTGLPSGKYELTINYNFLVESFGGKKRFIMTTASWIGGKNPFLGICYIVVGSLCMVFGFIFLVIHKNRTKFGSGSR